MASFFVAVCEIVDKQIECPPPELGDRNLHGRQRGRHIARNWNVIESGECDRVGNSDLRFAKGAQDADSHGVIGGKYGGRRSVHCDQPVPCGMAGFFAEVAVEFHSVTDGFPIPAKPLGGVGVLCGAFDKRDAVVAERTEMPHHRLSAAVVINGDGLHEAGNTVQEDHRKSRRKVRAKRSRLPIRRHDDQSVNATAHGAKHGGHLLSIAVKSGNEEVIAPSPCLSVDASNHFREKLAMQVREKKADGLRAPQTQASRHSVRSEVQRLTGLHHSPGGGLTHRAFSVQNSRNSGHRDAGFRGDFLDGDPTMRIRH